jgi:hypothetical protein
MICPNSIEGHCGLSSRSSFNGDRICSHAVPHREKALCKKSANQRLIILCPACVEEEDVVDITFIGQEEMQL